MAVDKLVDSTQLDSDLNSIANAILDKSGGTGPIAFPSGFVSEIQAIPSGGGGGNVDSLINRNISAISNSTVTTIGVYAFARCSSLTTANFPAVTNIGDYAFASCYALSEISFPSVRDIKAGAFQYCSKLKTVYFSAVTSISTNTFANCSSLTTVSFPAVTSIGYGAFSYCRSLTTISFPKARSAGSNAFISCYLLTTVSLPAIKSINTQCFTKCYHLLSLYLLGSSYCSLANTNAFSSTPISTYTTSTGGIYGSIFVRESMYSSYIAMTNWAVYSARFVSLTNAQITALNT